MKIKCQTCDSILEEIESTVTGMVYIEPCSACSNQKRHKDIKKIIEDEIIWCEEHRGTKSEVYEEAFIAGLKQVLFFIEEFTNEENLSRKDTL
jgi:hypothetical protein